MQPSLQYRNSNPNRNEPSGLIQKLSPEVIHRIAAGEVVQRPSAALKELLENSLDANCTTIAVTCKDGGLGALQVKDDGKGIHVEDFPLLCERFATSKLHQFSDLEEIATFGFRGEALASLSYVGRVEITSKLRDDVIHSVESAGDTTVGWRGSFANGALLSPPQPCAASSGTTVRVENLFSNCPTRRSALKPQEEWSRILDVVMRYSLAFPSVGFSCWKEAQNASSASKPSRKGSSATSVGVSFSKHSTTLQNIRAGYGNTVASHMRLLCHIPQQSLESEAAAGRAQSAEAERQALMNRISPYLSPTELSYSSTLGSKIPISDHEAVFEAFHLAADNLLRLRFDNSLSSNSSTSFAFLGYTSDVTLEHRGTNVQAGRSFLSLFINNRLVEHSGIRRLIETVYSPFLSSSGGSTSCTPFTVLFIAVPGVCLDANMHPTKQEVSLLHEDAVLFQIGKTLRETLLCSAQEQHLDTMRISKQMIPSSVERAKWLQDEGIHLPSTDASAQDRSWRCEEKLHPSRIVRVEPQRGSLDAFFKSLPSKVAVASNDSCRSSEQKKDETASLISSAPSRKEPGELIEAVGKNNNTNAEFVRAQHCLELVIDDASLSPHNDNLLEEDDIMSDFREFQKNRSGEGQLFSENSHQNFLSARGETDESQCTQKYRLEEGAVPIEKAPVPIASFSAKSSTDIECGESQKKTIEDDATFKYDEVLLLSSSLSTHPIPKLGNSTALEVEPLLSSVIAIVDHFNTLSSPKAEAFQEKMAFVGVVDAFSFLVQCDLDLLVVDTRQIAKELVFQLIFRRWYELGVPRRLQYSMREKSAEMPNIKWNVLLPPVPLSFNYPVEVSYSIEQLLYVALGRHLIGVSAEPHISDDLIRLILHYNSSTKHTSSKVFSLQEKHEIVKAGAQVALTSLFLPKESSSTREETGEPFVFSSTGRSSNEYSHASLDEGPSPTPCPNPVCSTGEILIPKRRTKFYVKKLTSRLIRWKEMLYAYFGIKISSDGMLHELSQEIGISCNTSSACFWSPSLEAIPLLLLRLADCVPYPQAVRDSECLPTVNGERETAEGDSGASSESMPSLLPREAARKECEKEIRWLTSIARHISEVLYGLGYPVKAFHANDDSEVPVHSREQLEDAVQHGLFPALKQKQLFKLPSNCLINGTIQHVVSVDALYKVFERC